MAAKRWTRQQLLIAFGLYCRVPFGRMHSKNSEIIKYAELIDRTPSALAMKLTNIASLDPAITSTGRKGLSSASNADKEMWEEMQNDWESFVIEVESEIAKIDKSGDESDANAPDTEGDYTGRDVETITKKRVGQSFFRTSVLSAYNYKCCITGLSIPKLLVASHIVPWRENPSNRLNPRNGLALSALHDKAFDLGLIAIDKNMRVILSNAGDYCSDEFYQTALKKYENKPIAMPDKFSPNKDFIAYHREVIFLG